MAPYVSAGYHVYVLKKRFTTPTTDALPTPSCDLTLRAAARGMCGYELRPSACIACTTHSIAQQLALQCLIGIIKYELNIGAQ